MHFYTKIITGILSFAFGTLTHAQKSSEPYNRPKLVVGIVVDQMRYDYLTRYWDRFGEDGFKKLVNEGFLAKNHHFNYVPTATAPGHASIYTGTTPSHHGILGNYWFDIASGKEIYCVSDDRYQTVGSTSKAGKMSPHRMESTTIGDELRISSNFQSKVVAIAIKDRGAVLPGGHTGKAYWFEGKKDGNWVSGSYYMESLPEWVKMFNKSEKAEAYKRTWNTLYPIETYTNSTSDDVAWEKRFEGLDKSVFPYDLPKLWKQNGHFDLVKETPFGNSITTDFALAALDGEELGEDDHTDLFSVSYSSTDYVGHRFGVRAVETEDTYLRLDQDIARLLKAIEAKVGKGNYTVFLTADHGAADNPGFMTHHNVPAGFVDRRKFKEQVEMFLEETFGSRELLKESHGSQLYFNRDVMDSLDLEAEDMEESLVPFLKTIPEVEATFTATQLEAANMKSNLGKMIQNGYNFGKSGDIFVVFSRGFISTGYLKGGADHGTAHIYDTHVPLILFGKGIVPGETHELTEIPDIAVTIASLLGTAMPNGATGKVITKAIE